MKKTVLFILFALILASGQALANLSISSFYVFFDANSPKRTDVVRLTNSTNQRKTYRLKMVNFKQNADGSYTPITQALPNNPFASPYIGFSPHETTLEPGQSQTVRIIRKPMAAAADGEYVSHLFVQELPEKRQTTAADNQQQIKIDIKALYGLTIPVIIDKGNLSSSAKISKTLAKNNGSKPYIEATIKRSGNRSFWGNLIVTQNGKEIGRVNGFKIFLTTPERQIQIPLTEKMTSSARITLEDARTNAVIASKNL